ncbi:valine--tRNA ligase [Candidatus Azambacteria bacterium]|nr:valine--tRNA ligase [Candidatus Azambacteria bacterium]
MEKNLDKFNAAYDPKKVEARIYTLWENSGFFNPDNLPVAKNAKTYTIALPPPNVTGVLHMGHALNATVQVWIPGTDHAGIATQNVVEKMLKKEGVSRHDLGKEKFLEKVWEWKEKYGNIILDQLKRLGASCDWSRTAFTMDPGYQEAVKTAFEQYRAKGLVYQGERVINWCARCATSLSDLELEYQEKKGTLYFIRYPLTGETKKHIIVATTRPETMLGDAAVAVHPDDPRYKAFVGKTVLLPIQEKEIPVVADGAVEKEFGTGAVKVTPAHSITDSEIGERHKLPLVKIIGERGKMTAAAKICEGLNVEDCRTKVVGILKTTGLLEKEEPLVHNVAHCYRCGKVIEQLASKQWFLKMGGLAKSAAEAVTSGAVRFHPENFKKPYLDWLSKTKDWCISRQIWWGHKIPVEGVDDVLDTWFSSALWPFATLGWPKEASDLKTFYPTQVLSTGRDIINLWVSRMIFSGLEFMTEIPFKDVYINPTVLAKNGQRMSKSLGTGINPLELVEKYGADVTRFGLIWQNMGVQDIHFAEEHLMAGKKFANKLWNISRFVLAKTAHTPTDPSRTNDEETTTLLAKLNATIQSTNIRIESFEFGQALHTLYDFVWHDFADVYIEHAKTKDAAYVHTALSATLTTILKLLHPFMPFVTEEIWASLPMKEKKLLMIEEWPHISHE